ncbi:hypothetical protein CNMCM5793_006242 [Aspergillus hiratsukae]|uniref:Ankyrin repeat protein n=1 Tax=Aspergillus hiratsukae TaxID=1194566 RepID=A0A8H6PHJ3_9EURO|nr:hypothetical protein CNMCM5793_006242 [Aspergillus hiratsukae]
MLRFMETVTDEPGWENEATNPATLDNWRANAFSQYGLSQQAWAWCQAELQDKPVDFRRTGYVMVFDADSRVCKSDTLVASDLCDDLQEAFGPLVSSIPIDSTQKPVRQLVDPSMYPLMYGMTRVLINVGAVGLELGNWEEYRHCQIAPIPVKPTGELYEMNQDELARKWDDRRLAKPDCWSTEFQWLPCEVSFEGDMMTPRITSYINNIHPKNKGAYKAIERLTSAAIAPWNEMIILGRQGRTPIRIRTYNYVEENKEKPSWFGRIRGWKSGDRRQNAVSDEEWDGIRSKVKECLSLPDYPKECRFYDEPDYDLLASMAPEDWESPDKVIDLVLDKWSRYVFHNPEPGISFTYSDWKAGRNTGRAILPEYDNFSPERALPQDPDHQYYSISLQERFRTEGLQIIVQVTSIELTPEHPTYAGDQEFHVAGMLNEHIVATAVYYYDVDNISGAKIFFEQEAVIDNNSFDVNNEDFINKVWDIPDCDVPEDDECWQLPQALQTLGAITISSGRFLVWPIPCGLNLNRSVWRVLLAQGINVPPQRRDWAAAPSERSTEHDDGTFMTPEKAREVRERTTAERKSATEKLNEHQAQPGTKPYPAENNSSQPPSLIITLAKLTKGENCLCVSATFPFLGSNHLAACFFLNVPMADPVSITGLIIQTIGVVGKVCKYSNQVKCAHDEIRELLGELFALKAIFEQIEKDPSLTRMLSSKPFQDTVPAATGTLEELIDDLESRMSRGERFWRQLGWPERKAKLQGNIQQLERLKTSLIMALLKDNRAIEEEMSHSINLLTDMGREMKEHHESKSKQKIKNWLCPVDVESMHCRARSLHHAGTGRWFIDGPYQEWFSGVRKERFLYLEGKYASQKLNRLLGGLLAQALDVNTRATEVLEAEFAKGTPLTTDYLIDCLSLFSESQEKVFIFVDATNESDEADEILSVMLRLINTLPCSYIMVTSTAPVGEDSRTLREVMKPSSNEGDIQAFVNSQLQVQPTLRRLPPDIKRDISETLMKKANGMFRYVRCQIDLLAGQKTGRNIPPHCRELAKEAFLWLTYSREALTLPALNEALAVERGDRFLDDECRLFDQNLILQACQGLIVYDEVTTVVTLAHSSVKTYLTSDDIQHGSASFFSPNEHSAARNIYQKCLTYIMFDAFCAPCSNTISLNERLEHFPLLSFSAHAWAQHCGCYAPAGFSLVTSEIDEIMDFFSTRELKNGGNFASWVQVIQGGVPSEDAQETEPLYFASLFGILPVVDRLIANGASVNIPDKRTGATAIIAATFNGQLAVVKKLLEAGADPSVEDHSKMTSLAWARHRSNDRIEAVLLVHRAVYRKRPAMNGCCRLYH